MTTCRIPLIIRGKILDEYDVEYGGRRGGATFLSADMGKHLDQLQLDRSTGMADQYQLSFQEILDYLEALGQRLDFETNVHLQEAFELSALTSGLNRETLKFFYRGMGAFFSKPMTTEVAQRTVGIPYLEGWVRETVIGGVEVSTRAFGARTVHIIAGNAPIVSAMSIVRNALTRGDAIIKTPSNDPMTATAIALTMIEMAPDHPLTRHLSVAYWKGGNEEVENVLYQPRNVEKIVAWGGMASIQHISKYIQPGIDLITLDPKLSSSFIGKDAFSTDASMREAAQLLAQDVGHYNQEGCVNARVVYIQTGTDEGAIGRGKQFASMVWQEIKQLPSFLSSPSASPDFNLFDEIESLRTISDEHTVHGSGSEGAVILSHGPEAVDFAELLNNRVVNLVPFEDIELPLGRIDTSTQTIGVYPEALKEELRDQLALAGAQRLVSLGYATAGVLSQPQDGIEPMRRMCKWISDESYSNVSSDPWGRN